MKLRKIVIGIIMFLLITLLFTVNKVEAADLPEGISEELSEQLQNMSNEDILEIYDQITEQYSNDEIADMILENKDQIAEEAGISESVINAGADFIRNTNQEAVRDILENDESMSQIRKTLQEGGTASEAVENAISNTTISQKTGLLIKILLANNIVKTIDLLLFTVSIFS